SVTLPGRWRNGRRSGLKIRRGNTHVGSSPTRPIDVNGFLRIAIFTCRLRAVSTKLMEAGRAELARAAAATDIDLTQEKLVVGVSGGPDSLALLHSLAQALRRELLIVAHLDHGLRPSSAAEAQRVAATALGLCFFTERTDVAELA